MGLFEVYREKTVEVRSKEKVFPSFRKALSITKILADLSGDTVLIMNSVNSEIVEWIVNHDAECTVYTTKPTTLAGFDALGRICEKCPTFIVPAIDLNYIYCNNTLYIIPERFSDSAASNVVLITAMEKKEIDTQIAIDLESIAQRYNLKRNDPQTSMFDDNQGMEDRDATSEEQASFAAEERRLLREEITRIMNERYSIVKTEMPNTSIERKTVSLTPFYKKNRIAQGRLRGTWEIFDKNTLPDVMDTGIAQRALASLYRQYTVSVENAYKLIRKEDIPQYRAGVVQIEQDYYGYLRGTNDRSVGSEKVKVPFSPEADIERSINTLKQYLCSVAPGACTQAETFADSVRWKVLDSISNVSCKTVLTSLSEEQLKDFAYVSKLWKAVCENSTFFDEDLIALVRRYGTSLHNVPEGHA